MDNKNESFVLIIFGITSNLAQIKLIPALYDIAEKNLLPKNSSIIGIARSKKSEEEFRKYFSSVLRLENKHHKHEIKKEIEESLLTNLHYIDGEVEDPDFYQRLKQKLERLEGEGVSCSNRIYYLATYPELYQQVFKNLQLSGLNDQSCGFVRLMIEKPIGNDLESAKKLNELLHRYFQEEQIYRLDHYLGKETLQNILTFRFGNGIFEPLINKEYIDHIQITAAEDFGIGKRGGYYDSVGALKDVGQNHQLQMIAFSMMDAPVEFANDPITKERVNIIKALIPLPDKVVFGQYQGYTDEESVKKDSKTDTFYAFKTEVNNKRFKGVPIYVRAGKKLKQTVTELSIVFKNPQNRLLKHLDMGEEPNVLIYRIQPNEGIVLKILSKKPGSDIQLEPTYMQFCYRLLSDQLPDAYEKLIVDAIKGDPTFFNDGQEVEAQWAFIDPLVKAKQEVFIYESGSWGPKEAEELIEADGRKWLEPSMAFCQL